MLPFVSLVLRGQALQVRGREIELVLCLLELDRVRLAQDLHLCVCLVDSRLRVPLLQRAIAVCFLDVGLRILVFERGIAHRSLEFVVVKTGQQIALLDRSAIGSNPDQLSHHLFGADTDRRARLQLAGGAHAEAEGPPPHARRVD